MTRHDRHDRGSGTIYALVLVAVVAATAVGAAAVGGAVIARHRAMSAADLAALAAADMLVRGGDPCAAAGHIAARQAVELISCSTTEMVVDVTVGVPVRGALGFGLVAQMRARAGPGGGQESAGLRSRGPPD